MNIPRREFISLIGGAAAAWPVAARAQQAGKRALIGFLGSGSKAGNGLVYDGFPQGMRELGYVEGHDYEYEDRYAKSILSRLPVLAEELVRIKTDVIVASNTAAVLAARQTTASIPIVGVVMTDPVSFGLVVSEARPGTNVTGILNRVEGLPGKQLEIALDLLPGVTTIGALVNSSNPSNAVQRREAEAAAAKLRVSWAPVEVRAADEIGAAFQTLVRARANIVVVLGDAMFIGLRRQIAAFALVSRLPTVFNFREHVEAGGLISYGINQRDNFRRSAYFVNRILKGEKAADLPVEFPTKLEMVVNQTTAKALGLTIPSSIMLRADEVIE